MSHLRLLAPLLLLGAPALMGQAAPPSAAAPALTAEARKAAVEALADRLAARFVFPEVGARYAARLRARLAEGAYEGLTEPAAFAARLTADLQGVAPDRHLKVLPAEAAATVRQAIVPGRGAAAAPQPPALEAKALWGEVAYLRFNRFPQDAAVAAEARAFLAEHAGAKALILDCRPNRGGDTTVMDAILPLLYAAPTTLVRMDTRAEAAAEEEALAATMVRQPAPKDLVRHDHRVVPEGPDTPLRQGPVYYLTSRRTGSAAEHLALALQRTHRATLVGEPTAGAGHFGWMEAFTPGFEAFIPVGRTYDPDTGRGWEATGVTPDVAVPAEGALAEALRRLRAAGLRTDGAPA